MPNGVRLVSEPDGIEHLLIDSCILFGIYVGSLPPNVLSASHHQDICDPYNIGNTIGTILAGLLCRSNLSFSTPKGVGLH